MIPKHWLQATVSLILVIATSGMPAQSPSTPSRVRLASVTGASAASGSAIAFDPVVVGGGTQQVKATFAMEGGYSHVIPSVSLHYGHDYSVGAISCADQTCSVTVSFAPTLPGARPDALFLTGNGQRIGTISLAGTGQAPYALLQPESSAPGSWTSGTSAVLDENGTLYLLNAAQGSLTSMDSTGVSATLTVSGLSSPRGLAIDGAGVLYVLNGGDASSLLTFDTVQQLQGSVPLPVSANQIDSISIGNAGELYAVSSATHALYTIAPDGTAAKSMLQGGGNGTVTSAAVLGAGGQLALGGSALQTVSAAGLQSPVALSSSAALAVLGTDAAGTLYANSNSTLLQLASPSFSAVVGALPAALALGSDGSLQVGTGQAISRMDRTQASLYFGPVRASRPHCFTTQAIKLLPFRISGSRALALRLRPPPGLRVSAAPRWHRVLRVRSA